MKNNGIKTNHLKVNDDKSASLIFEFLANNEMTIERSFVYSMSLLFIWSIVCKRVS